MLKNLPKGYFLYTEFDNKTFTSTKKTYDFPRKITLNKIGSYEIRYYVLMTCRNDLTCTDVTDTLTFKLNIKSSTINNVITREYDYKTIGDLQRWVQKNLLFEINEETELKVFF